MRNSGNRRRAFWSAVGCLCFLAAAGMAGMAGRTLLSYRSSERSLERMYEDIRELSRTADGTGAGNVYSGEDGEGEAISGDDGGGNVGNAEEKTAPELSYEDLQSLNSDMIGWIRIPDTVIDYPVMYTPDDPDFYFHRDFYKRSSSYGMIYLDASCRPDGTTPNLLLYGHHMRNGSMFASIEKYGSREYQKNHPLIWFNTADGDASYEVLGALRISGGEISQEFMAMLAARTEADYENLMQYIAEHTLYQTGITAQWPDQLLTLTTCEYSQKDGRFLLITKKQGSWGNS